MTSGGILFAAIMLIVMVSYAGGAWASGRPIDGDSLMTFIICFLSAYLVGGVIYRMVAKEKIR